MTTMNTAPSTPLSRRASERGFTLVEMIVVSLLLLIAMLGLLAVFDASARINKNETDVADAQGAVRYGIYQMTRVIRMAGAGGLYVTQAVLNHNDAELPGINGRHRLLLRQRQRRVTVDGRGRRSGHPGPDPART